MTIEITGQLNAADLEVAIVISRFNNFLTQQLLGGAIDCFERHGGDSDSMTVVWVPGANEIPVAVKHLAGSGKFAAVIALGAVIQGATPHADLINTQVSRALASIATEHGLPVINGVVCANTIEQAIERSGTKAGNKGWDAAMAAIEMARVCAALSAAL